MSLVWSKVSKLLGSIFLVGGGTVSVGLLLGILTSQASGFLLGLLSTLLVFFGLAPLALGGVLLYASSQARRQALRERFFQLLQASGGRLSVIEYATANYLEPGIARQQLDVWAREFDARFEVTEAGEIYYIFTTRPEALPPGTVWGVLGQNLRQWLKTTI